MRVVTTLSPSRNSVSSVYMTELIASVVLRCTEIELLPDAPSHAAIVSKAASNLSVVASEASD